MFLISFVVAEIYTEPGTYTVTKGDAVEFGERAISVIDIKINDENVSWNPLFDKPSVYFNVATLGEGESSKVTKNRYGPGSDESYAQIKVNSINIEDGTALVTFIQLNQDDEIKDEDDQEKPEAKEQKIKKAIQSRNRLRIQSKEQCPINCTCTGSATKCQLGNGIREMTITAGKSGNTIVQVKGAEMQTKVELYKSGEEVYGVFKGNTTKLVKIMPDQVKEKIRARLKQKDCDCEKIELDEDGKYQVQTKKKAKLFRLFTIREKVRMHIDSETGEITKIKNPWWGFLAKDIEEELVGDCGTVTPGLENECCQNLGYTSWNSENIQCE